MGQCCSDIAGSHDPDDMSLDFINLSVTAFPSADEFYEEATTVLDEAVDVHNSVIDAIENLKMAGASMLGSKRPVVKVVDGRVSLTTIDYDGNEVDMMNTTSPKLKLAQSLHLECQKTITTLNKNNTGDGLSVRGGIKLVGQNCAEHTVAIFNRQIYMYSKELMLLSGTIDAEVYARTLKAELAKLGQKVTFAVSTNDDGSLRIEASRFQASQVPDGARNMLTAFKTLEDEFRLKAEDLPHLREVLQDCVDKAGAFVLKIEDAVGKKMEGMSEDSLIHAKANLTKIEAGKQIIDNLLLTMRDFGNNVKFWLEEN
mmetsp:Transcript_37876/g.48311  ORF Transcript_37876/g.48311 Transcript_37876/m.48311 type:complete len:314 (-) Transcript_37876:535-1476(-)